jgi:hypothetical protein
MMMDSHTMDLEFRRKTLEIDYGQGKRLCRILYTGQSRAGSVRSEVMETILEALYSGTKRMDFGRNLKVMPSASTPPGKQGYKRLWDSVEDQGWRARACHWPTRRAWRAGGVLV